MEHYILPFPPCFPPQVCSSLSQIGIMSLSRFNLANLYLVNFGLLLQPLRILYSYRFWSCLLIWGVCLIYLKSVIKKNANWSKGKARAPQLMSKDLSSGWHQLMNHSGFSNSKGYKFMQADLIQRKHISCGYQDRKRDYVPWPKETQTDPRLAIPPSPPS